MPLLSKVLENEKENTMVRHECGEALGAIGDESALPVLKTFLKDEERAIRETCELAIQRIENVKLQPRYYPFHTLVDHAGKFSMLHRFGLWNSFL